VQAFSALAKVSVGHIVIVFAVCCCSRQVAEYKIVCIFIKISLFTFLVLLLLLLRLLLLACCCGTFWSTEVQQYGAMQQHKLFTKGKIGPTKNGGKYLRGRRGERNSILSATKVCIISTSFIFHLWLFCNGAIRGIKP